MAAEKAWVRSQIRRSTASPAKGAGYCTGCGDRVRYPHDADWCRSAYRIVEGHVPCGCLGVGCDVCAHTGWHPVASRRHRVGA